MSLGYLIFVSLLAGACSPDATSAQSRDDAAHRFTGEFVGQRARADVVEKLVPDPTFPGGSLNVREFSISCLGDNCAGFQGAVETSSDAPLAMAQPIALGPFLVVVWGGATSFPVTVYRIDKKGAKRVFEGASRIFPVVRPKGSNAIEIDLSDFSPDWAKKGATCIWEVGDSASLKGGSKDLCN